MMYGSLCTEYYDADKQFAPEDEISFYKKNFNKEDLILEPMCGSGRLLIPLLQAGYNVHGIDNSKEMLSSLVARANIKHLNPTIQEANIEELRTDKQYNGIIIPLGSFQLINPRKKVGHILDLFHRLLKKSGKLILDLFIPWGSLSSPINKEYFTKSVKTHNEDIIKISNNTTIYREEQYLISKTKYEKFIEGNLIDSQDEEMKVAWYYRYEFELLLQLYGFKNVTCVERLLNVDKSPHMTFIAKI